MNKINQLNIEFAADMITLVADVSKVCIDLGMRFTTIADHLNEVLAMTKLDSMLSAEMQGLTNLLMQATALKVSTLVPFVLQIEARISSLTNFELPIGTTEEQRGSVLTALGLLHREGIAMRTKLEAVRALCRTH